MVFPFMMFCMACTLPFGVKVMNMLGSPRKAAVVLTILCAGSIFFSSFATVFAAFCVIYGILFGFFSGLLYMMPIYCGYLYFPNKKGIVSGLVLTGYGFGSFIFNFMALGIINPDNEKATPFPDKDSKTSYYWGVTEHISDKVPECLRYLSLCYLILGLLASILFIDPREE